ncbi:hypothetical protein KPATCC21470_6133 [Kitasatospora purpeofusca]
MERRRPGTDLRSGAADCYDRRGAVPELRRFCRELGVQV